jgi:hypothetical protein
MSKIILVDIRNVYGQETIYPANQNADIFASIAGTKTLTKRTLQYAEQLGYTIGVGIPELTLNLNNKY